MNFDFVVCACVCGGNGREYWFYLAVICLALYFYYIIVLIVRDTRWHLSFLFLLSVWFVISFCILHVHSIVCHFAIIYLFVNRLYSPITSCSQFFFFFRLAIFLSPISEYSIYFFSVLIVFCFRLSFSFFFRLPKETCNEFVIMIKW